MSLKDEGISPYWCIHHGITVSMYYGDPDGNQMEFQVDCFAENDEANAFMYRSFSINPIGVEYDPEEWLAEVRSGMTVENLLARKSDLPVSPIRSAVGAGFAPPGGCERLFKSRADRHYLDARHRGVSVHKCFPG